MFYKDFYWGIKPIINLSTNKNMFTMIAAMPLQEPGLYLVQFSLRPCKSDVNTADVCPRVTEQPITPLYNHLIIVKYP